MLWEAGHDDVSVALKWAVGWNGEEWWQRRKCDVLSVHLGSDQLRVNDVASLFEKGTENESRRKWTAFWWQTLARKTRRKVNENSVTAPNYKKTLSITVKVPFVILWIPIDVDDHITEEFFDAVAQVLKWAAEVKAAEEARYKPHLRNQ